MAKKAPSRIDQLDLDLIETGEMDPVSLMILKSLVEDVKAVLKTLTYRERELVKMYYGIPSTEFSYTVEEIGRIFRVPPERVKKILQKAIKKLRAPERLSRLLSYAPPERPSTRKKRLERREKKLLRRKNQKDSTSTVQKSS